MEPIFLDLSYHGYGNKESFKPKKFYVLIGYTRKIECIITLDHSLDADMCTSGLRD